MNALRAGWHATRAALVLAGVAGCRHAPLPGDRLRPVEVVTGPGEPGSRYPHLAATPHGSPVLSWLQQKPGSVYSYELRMSVSRDAGASWSAAVSSHDDGTPTEHGFVSLFGDEGAGALWLDGRHTGGGHDHEAGVGRGSRDPRPAVHAHGCRGRCGADRGDVGAALVGLPADGPRRRRTAVRFDRVGRSTAAADRLRAPALTRPDAGRRESALC